MKVTIIGKDKEKWGNGANFIRVYFEPEGGGWCKTDLVPDNKNWKDWKDLIEVGNILEGVEMYDKKTVNADSRPHLVGRIPPPLKQAELF